METAMIDASFECGINTETISKFSSNFIERMQRLCGGDVQYFPKRVNRSKTGNTAEFISKKARDAAIKREFTGANHKELSEKYNCSEKTVRRAVSGKP